MNIKTDQWVGVKGLVIYHKQYSLGLFCKALIKYRAKKYPEKIPAPFGQYTFKELIFSIKRNQRMAVLEWHTDITLLGFTFQFEKYKPECVL